MTDEELLDRAAKAVGYALLSNGQACSQDTGNFDWNPLTDDGDAFRLAVSMFSGYTFLVLRQQRKCRKRAAHSVWRRPLRGDAPGYCLCRSFGW